MIADHALVMIADRGSAAVSMTAIGSRLGISGQAIAKWCGSVDQMWVWIVGTFTSRWVQWIDRRSYVCGGLALVPHRADEVSAARVLVALDEVVRSRAAEVEDLAEVFGELRQHERKLLTSVHPRLVDPAEVDRLHAFVEGLRIATCRSVDPLPPAAAVGLLAAACRAGAGPLAPWLSPMASEQVGLPRLVEPNQPGEVIPSEAIPTSSVGGPRHRADAPWDLAVG
jgi:AcrR family transcriptional regulator